MTERPSESQIDAAEQRLANLVANLADQANMGRELDLETVCRQNPEFAHELRQLWGTLAVTRAAGSSSPSIGSSELPASFDLPFEFGDYLLQEEIGRGGMGIVYRAQRLTDKQTVAIKMILKGEFATAAERQRFQAEAEAAARLSHPNIIPIYEMGEHQGRAFFCMQLIEGQTLSQRLQQGPIPSRRAAHLLLEISGAIDYAHQQGVLHRDLKPSNILIDDRGVPYVVDFGLAKQAQVAASLTKSGAVLGTPSYMAPEQAAGTRGEVGVASDVYSLGAILYHMLTGRPPFLGATSVDTVLMVLEQDPIPPRALNRRADRNLELIAMRCLQKPQDLRYASASQLCGDLDAFLNNETVSANEGRFGQVIAHVFRETHHASVLENWGLLWMWHSLVLLVACVATNALYWMGVKNPLHYWLMWTAGLGTWAAVFWWVRRRMGPVTFVERQIAHVWAASMIGIAFLFPLEVKLGLEVLTLAPILPVVAGMTFLIKAGILSGTFYIQAFALFATTIPMAIWPDFALVMFGLVSAACFFFSGRKYYRQRLNQSTITPF